MSAPTILVIQMQHVTTLLDPSSALVRKDLLEMVVTAQVWNADASLRFPSAASIILTHTPVLLLAIFIYHSFFYICYLFMLYSNSR